MLVLVLLLACSFCCLRHSLRQRPTPTTAAAGWLPRSLPDQLCLLVYSALSRKDVDDSLSSLFFFLRISATPSPDAITPTPPTGAGSLALWLSSCLFSCSTTHLFVPQLLG